LEAPADGFRWNVPVFSHRIRFDVLRGCETCPLESSEQGTTKKSLVAKFGEYGGWVMTGTAAQQAMCGSVRYRDAETTIPATPSKPHCTTLQNLHV
jgi:hypothetical protein